VIDDYIFIMKKQNRSNIIAVFSGIDYVLLGIKALQDAGMNDFLVYSPIPHHDIEHLLHRKKSPVRIFTLIGAVTGFVTGWALTIGSVMNYPLIVGGKPLISGPPFGVIAYILTILFGVLATMIGFLINARFPQFKLNENYDERLSSDHFGIQVNCDENDFGRFEEMMKNNGAVEIRRPFQ
jgi:molybdopterin-containing oxidoreductase family membrane subunit